MSRCSYATRTRGFELSPNLMCDDSDLNDAQRGSYGLLLFCPRKGSKYAAEKVGCIVSSLFFSVSLILGLVVWSEL